MANFTLTHQSDELARPELYRLNGIKRVERLENLLIILKENDISISSTVNLPANEEIIETLSSISNKQLLVRGCSRISQSQWIICCYVEARSWSTSRLYNSWAWCRIFGQPFISNRLPIAGRYPGRTKLCVLHELGNKTQLGVWAHCEPLNGFKETRG